MIACRQTLARLLYGHSQAWPVSVLKPICLAAGKPQLCGDLKPDLRGIRCLCHEPLGEINLGGGPCLCIPGLAWVPKGEQLGRQPGTLCFSLLQRHSSSTTFTQPGSSSCSSMQVLATPTVPSDPLRPEPSIPAVPKGQGPATCSS